MCARDGARARVLKPDRQLQCRITAPLAHDFFSQPPQNPVGFTQMFATDSLRGCRAQLPPASPLPLLGPLLTSPGRPFSSRQSQFAAYHFCDCYCYFLLLLLLLPPPSPCAQRPKRQPKPSDEGFWDCSVCTYKNTAEAFKCMMCDVRKGTSTR